MSNQGWVKLHRQLLDWEWFDDHNTFRLFMYLLLKTNHKNAKWRGVEIKCGEVLISIEKLAKSTTLSVQQVRTSLSKLKSTGEITIKTTSKYTVIELVKYGVYQINDEQDNNQNNKQDNKQITNNQQTNNKQITTNKKEKNKDNDNNENNVKEKTIKKERGTFSKPSFDDNFEFIIDLQWRDLFKKWINYKNQTKKPLLPVSYKASFDKLVKFSKDDLTVAKEIIGNAIAGGWVGFHEIDEPKYKGGGQNKPTTSKEDRQKRSDEEMLKSIKTHYEGGKNA